MTLYHKIAPKALSRVFIFLLFWGGGSFFFFFLTWFRNYFIHFGSFEQLFHFGVGGCGVYTSYIVIIVSVKFFCLKRFMVTQNVFYCYN